MTSPFPDFLTPAPWLPELWLIVTFAAAVFQTLRFMLQKYLATATLSATGATFARFFYSAPLVALILALCLWWSGVAMPHLSKSFFLFAAVGGAAQVIATTCVVRPFKARNFAVGVTLMKTEVILSVVIGLVVLGEGVSLSAFGAIALGLVGVLLLSTPPDVRGFGFREMWNKAVGLGLTSGVLFAVSAVCYRGASLQIASDQPLIRAGVTLSAVTLMQMIGMALWLWWREPGQIEAVWRARRVAVWIGLMSMAGSMGWFTAFTLQTAAYVKAVGQVELVLSLLASVLFFRERSSLRELTGMAVLCASIVALVLLV
jgi:drug/metabolite transporter (DMT)-like permease